MDDQLWLTHQFEACRPHLRGVAYRMLGSLSEAEDAVQETWLRVNRASASDVANLGGWLTTITARICLDMLRTRTVRREDSLDSAAEAQLPADAADPEAEVLLAESVGLALLVVLETLSPLERLAFVLHDIFAMPFETIAPLVQRTPVATRKLASRARQRVRGGSAPATSDQAQQRHVIEAFLTAARAGNFAALLEILAPNVVLHDGPNGLNGPVAVAESAIKSGARAARLALIDGEPGVVVAPRGRLALVLRFKLRAGRIEEMTIVRDAAALRQCALALLD